MPGATVIVPSAFNVKPTGTLTGVKVASAGFNGKPFKVSLVSTLAVLPPGVPLIGLGVSSISDSWYSFAQNVKEVEEYQSLVEDGVLPVYRGHILSDEDLIIRKHILNLMCSLKTSWKDPKLYIKEIPEIILNLKEMELDNLIEITDTGLHVKELGRPFVRNICMAFDLLLQRKRPDTQLFSMTV